MTAGSDDAEARVLLRVPGEHHWEEWRFTRMTMTCCRWCGIVQRRDGKNKPCPGIIRVELRAAGLAAQDPAS